MEATVNEVLEQQDHLQTEHSETTKLLRRSTGKLKAHLTTPTTHYCTADMGETSIPGRWIPIPQSSWDLGKAEAAIPPHCQPQAEAAIPPHCQPQAEAAIPPHCQPHTRAQ